MATTNSLFLKGMRGTINKELVFKQYGNQTVAAKYPDMSKVVRSEKQLKNNELMREANAIARAVMKDEGLKRDAQIRLNVSTNKLYTSLIQEYFKKSKSEEDSDNSTKKVATKMDKKR